MTAYISGSGLYPSCGDRGATCFFFLTMKMSDFDLSQTTLSKISHVKERAGKKGDPTESGLTNFKSRDDNVYFRPVTGEDGYVYLRAYQERKLQSDIKQGSFPIGKPVGDWIYFNEQKCRATQQAVECRFGSIVLNPELPVMEQIQGELAKIASPFDLSYNDSEYLGLFFDGTGNFREKSETNIYELYKIYEGNKCYYGGIGNSVENNLSGLKSAFAFGFDNNIERAISDIELFLNKTSRRKKIQIFGFSRGAAQANELAIEMKSRALDVDLLLMIDPVYSIGVPGQGSKRVHTSPLGREHNYVQRTITDNVRKAVILYAKHETRVWFPATKFDYNKTKTELIAGLTPGNHCDAGGFWQRNGAFQYVSLYWLLENIASGITSDPFSGNLSLTQ